MNVSIASSFAPSIAASRATGARASACAIVCRRSVGGRIVAGYIPHTVWTSILCIFYPYIHMVIHLGYTYGCIH